jgi:Zn-dependent M28 family amino/carboxypeptidase
MKHIAAAGLIALVSVVSLSAADGDGKHWWSYVEALANDGMQGRQTGSAEHRKAAEYVASQFQRAGLMPAGVNGYVQPVPFDVRRIVESQSSLELIRAGRAERLTLGEDATIALRTNPADSVEAPLVFAGYGLVVPEANFNDFAGLDLKGKIVVTLAGGPTTVPGNLRAHYGYATERGRFLEQAGAIGLVTIPNPKTSDVPWARASLARLQESMSLADPSLVDMKNIRITANINAAHADKWLAGSGHTIAELLALADAGKALPRFPLTASLRARVKGDAIYNGAMDNASGVASLLEIARSLREAKPGPRRSVLFVVVTGEEKGLLGSRYFAAHPTVDASRMIADLNIDMFLPLYPMRLLTVYGLGESDLGVDVRKVAASMKVDVQDDPAPQRNVFVRSDQYNFIRHGIPAVKIDFGSRKGSAEEAIDKAWLENRYHAPSDDLSQPVDLTAAAAYNQFMTALTTMVAKDAARPRWKAESFFQRFTGPQTATK